MTCIVALKHANKVYMGSDSRVSIPSLGIFIDNEAVKIIKVNNILIGFAGHRGIQDMFELFKPDFSNIKYQDLIKKLSNILNLFGSNNSELLVTDGATIDYVSSNGSHHNSGFKSQSGYYYNVIGCGHGLIDMYFCAGNKELSPVEKIKEAINLASGSHYAVGGEPVVFEI